MNKDKQRLLEIAGVSKPKLNEGAEINPKYTHFAVLKNTGKIINGWEYEGYDPQELKMEKDWYFWTDIKDMDISPKVVSILTKQYLERNGINPFDVNNWHQGQHDDSSFMSDKDSQKHLGF